MKVLLFVILLIGCFLSYYYSQSDKPIVTIYPEEAPTKIKPQNSGGLILPNSNNIVYESLRSQKYIAKPSTLLPEPEKPINISNNKVTDPIDNILENLTNNTIENTDQSFDLMNSQSEGEQVKTGLSVIKIIPKNTDHKAIHSLSIDKGNYKLQLASVKSEAEAILEGNRIKKKYPKILGNTNITHKKISSTDGKIFYLVIAESYKTLSQAKSICKKLAGNQQICLIMKAK